MPKGLVVADVQPGSIAEEMEIVPGDRILAVNEQELKDIIDFQYLTADEEFTLLVEKEEGEVWELEIERDLDEELGLEVQAVSAEGLKLCKNNCLFCFVAQMPEGMRASLYDKDDDYRLSLTQGSFITLSNLSDTEFDRILHMHLSPLYISVHAWSPEERVRLMKNPKAGDLAIQFAKLAAAGITIHAQIVLVPGYNDGRVLEETVSELAKLYPAVQSIAVVPVGLTRYRQGLPDLRGFTKEESQHILEQGERWQAEYFQATGRRLVYFSDEFYAQAGFDFPGVEVYDDFPQLENGVGMASKFLAEVEDKLRLLPQAIPERTVHILTGTSATPFFQRILHRFDEYTGLNLNLHTLENRFFGTSVTVAGLLTAQDIAEQLPDLNGEIFLIPSVMLKSDEDIFLDNQSVTWLAEKVHGVPLIVENHGAAFIEAVTGLVLEGETIE
ncbi:Fe-S oxidoreductase [Desulfitobacterium metallireducens DSM 15288]|uniref:Fe-S oxidoreductase n=1 Tax=Desulfitobacterium metallireducens DSM 15288 TaxID=871968 RepID=W0E8U8_9FIRM|nr:Fe-S oxidoreductase [Desulfitobacterium metallireducens DSM 15288]